jgi:hypothetical protein
MSWDEIGKNETNCPCGKGKYVVTLEADDWNRMRTQTEIQCSACRKKNKQAICMIRSHQTHEHKLRKTAAREAKKRFFPVFKARFAGNSKREIWEQLFKAYNYPALGTFYSHIRSDGSVDAYLEKHFLRNLDDFFPAMFMDPVIESLLAQARTEKKKSEQTASDWADYLPSDE